MTRGTYVIDRRKLKERLSKISELGGSKLPVQMLQCSGKSCTKNKQESM